MGRPAAAANTRFNDTMQIAQAKLAQIKTDLEHSSSAAAEEWESIKCKAGTCNVLCWILPVLGWCCYCWEAHNSPTAHYVHDIDTMQQFDDRVEAMRKARPVLRLNIECGHNEERTTTDSEGNTSTSTVYVQTFANSTDITGFSKVQDETPSAKELYDLVGRMTRQPLNEGDIMLLEIHVDAFPVDEDSASRLFAEANQWYDRNTCDRIHKYWYEWTLDVAMPSGNRCCVPVSSDLSSTPEWLSEAAFRQAVLTGCAYCYRKKIFTQSRKVEVHVVKHFSMSAESAAIFPQVPPFSVRKAVPLMAQIMSSAADPAPTSSMESVDNQPPGHATGLGAPKAKFCGACGTPSDGQESFCANCGKPLTAKAFN
jgi:hypothetical protein